jgi:cytoskeletal protein CcmA (bactofilin family)
VTQLKSFNDGYDGDLTLSDDLRLNGQVRGNVTVPAGVTLDCYGQITGDLIVERDGTAAVYGTVAGRIQNKGGMVHLHGMAGAVEDTGPTRTTIEPTATVLRGKR